MTCFEEVDGLADKIDSCDIEARNHVEVMNERKLKEQEAK